MECDGTDFSAGLSTCGNVVGTPFLGVFFCTDTCTIDDSNCQVPPATPATAVSSSCKNGIIDPGELCDINDFGNLTCASYEGAGTTGSFFCTDSCTIDTSDCEAALASAPISLCGNGSIDPGEQCDTFSLGEITCEDLGFVYGDLARNDDCTLNTGDCSYES